MQPDIFEAAMDYASARGLKLHPAIEHREVDGIAGMYANKKIQKGERLASYPIAKVLRPDAKRYPASFSGDLQYCHAACEELNKGKDSEYWGIFLGLESTETLEANNAYFFSEQELNKIDAMSKLLGARIREHIEFIDNQVAAITSFDQSIDESLATRVCLNNQSRTWSDSGFIPVMDLFNHSDRHGAPRQRSKREFFFVAARDIRPGEQVFISYSTKDLYLHAINYGYFDPSGEHFIHFGYRFIQTARTEFEKALAQATIQAQPTKHELRGNDIVYRSVHPEAVFTIDGPTSELVAYIKSNAFSNPERLLKKQQTKDDFIRHFSNALDALASCICVDSVPIEDLPPKLQLFHHALKKEQRIIEANRQWMTKNV